MFYVFFVLWLLHAITWLRGRSRARNLLAVLLMPAVAAALYPLWYRSGVSINEQLGLVVGLIVWASVALFGYAGYRVFARRAAGRSPAARDAR